MPYINIFRNVKSGKKFDPTQRPDHDDARVEALRRYEIFATPTEEIFSAYTELAALTFHTPIALMSFVDSEKVFYKQSYGVNRTGQLVDRKNSPCSIAIMNKEVTLFRYALSDPCVLADEKNLAEAGYKFYAGAPLVSPDDYSIGMLAVVDKNPRTYSNEELDRLKTLAGEVMNEVELRLAAKKNTAIANFNQRLKVLHQRVQALRNRPS